MNANVIVSFQRHIVTAAPPGELRGAQEAVAREAIQSGMDCPCCKQFCKVYARPLSSTMTRALIYLYQWRRRSGVSGFVHFAELLAPFFRSKTAGGDPMKLKYWGFIESYVDVIPEAQREDGSKRMGWHRITQRGIDFVERRVMRVPRYAYVYGMVLLGLSDELIDIDRALGKKFNFAQLMDGASTAPTTLLKED